MPRSRVGAQQRLTIVERAYGCCEYCLCQADFATQSFSVEHIVPVSQGGSNSLDNLALACQGCNSHKHAKSKVPDPIDGELVNLYHPRRQKWTDHFRWSEDYTLIIGLTPVGRATVESLKLNRPNLVNLRRVLFALGEHPPEYKQEE
jgi:hypothetical protein